jgi:hypothetical protein
MRSLRIRTPPPTQHRIVVAVHPSVLDLFFLVQEEGFAVEDFRVGGHWRADDEWCGVGRGEDGRRREEVGELTGQRATTRQKATEMTGRSSHREVTGIRGSLISQASQLRRTKTTTKKRMVSMVESKKEAGSSSGHLGAAGQKAAEEKMS